MEEDRTLNIGQDLVERIDKSRGEIERKKFVELCITMFLENNGGTMSEVFEEELMNRVDRLRGNLSRNKFIEFCVDNYADETRMPREGRFFAPEFSYRPKFERLIQLNYMQLEQEINELQKKIEKLQQEMIIAESNISALDARALQLAEVDAALNNKDVELHEKIENLQGKLARRVILD